METAIVPGPSLFALATNWSQAREPKESQDPIFPPRLRSKPCRHFVQISCQNGRTSQTHQLIEKNGYQEQICHHKPTRLLKINPVTQYIKIWIGLNLRAERMSAFEDRRCLVSATELAREIGGVGTGHSSATPRSR